VGPLLSLGWTKGESIFQLDLPKESNIMRHLAIVVATLALFLVAHPASAEPSILGPTGLFVNPTADITPVDHMWVAVNFFDNGGSAIWNANVTG
jgi:hypothetical protein